MKEKKKVIHVGKMFGTIPQELNRELKLFNNHLTTRKPHYPTGTPRSRITVQAPALGEEEVFG